VGKDGAAVQAQAVAQAVKLDPEKEFPAEMFTQSLIAFARTPKIQEKIRLVQIMIRKDASQNLLEIAWVGL